MRRTAAVFVLVVGLVLRRVFGYWVVEGYHVPPILIAGPYASSAGCQRMAADLNRIQLSFAYHCEMH